MSDTSENWRRTSRSCIMVVRRDKWKIRDSQTCRYDGQIYFHWYKILGLLYKIVLFNLQFVHNLFWLKLKWNVRSKLSYWYHLSCFDEVQGHWQNESRNLRNALMNGNINIWNIRTRITPERTRKNYRISIWRQI